VKGCLLAAALALAAAGCNVETLADYPCPPGGTTLTYGSFAQPFFVGYCNTCHSAPNGQRNGAPDDYVFDTQAEIVSHADRIFALAADTNTGMPPGPEGVPSAERVRLAEWLACGAP
jgi:uncharacterized membrane protein